MQPSCLSDSLIRLSNTSSYSFKHFFQFNFRIIYFCVFNKFLINNKFLFILIKFTVNAKLKFNLEFLLNSSKVFYSSDFLFTLHNTLFSSFNSKYLLINSLSKKNYIYIQIKILITPLYSIYTFY